MKRMPNISLSEQALQQLKERKPLRAGGESVVYSSDDNTIYKIFTDPRNSKLVGMSENKLQKILLIYQMELEHSVKPISTISYNGKLIGYEMIKEINSYSLRLLLRKDRIEFLKQTRHILEYFASKDITYGDIKKDNILVSSQNGSFLFGDIDNVQIGEYPIDLITDDLAYFIDQYGSIDEHCDAYMHNLMTLKYLNYYADSYQDILCGIKDGTLPRRFTKEALPTIKSMITPADFTGEYIIQYVKK